MTEEYQYLAAVEAVMRAEAPPKPKAGQPTLTTAQKNKIIHLARKRLAELLRADHPLTAEDKAFLADLIEGKHLPPKHRPPEPPYSPTWWLHQTAKKVRAMQDRGHKRAAAVEIVLLGEKLQGRDMERRRGELLQLLTRSKKTRTK